MGENLNYLIQQFKGFEFQINVSCLLGNHVAAAIFTTAVAVEMYCWCVCVIAVVF